MLSSLNRFSLALLATLLLLASPALAQGGSDKQEAKPDDTVSEKGFRGRIFELKHSNPEQLHAVIRPLGSGFRGATISSNREFKTITVRDFPENIAVMEEAIKRLDVPEPARPDIEFRVHILIATNSAQSPGGATQLPAELNDVVRQLQTTLSYKNYHLMTSQVVRGKEGPGGLGNKGVAELRLTPDTTANENPIFYEYRLNQIWLDAAGTNPLKVQLGNFNFSMRIPLQTSAAGTLQYENVGFNTPVGMREGEKVVVGTTSMQDKGIIVVLVANVIK
ncbi:MAG TPA: secretin N-terminal domain-containing protein [Pyrinomonadaceae bacterium]